MTTPRPQRADPASRVNPGRRAALRALIRVERGERGDHALDAEAPAEGRDRALAWHLLHGTLQHRAELDHIITTTARRSLERIDPRALALLRLAVFELRHSRAPARAVVHQAVGLAKLEGSAKAAGFVNAVLRNQGRVGEIPPRLQLNHPAWLLDRWERRYGAEACARWAQANNTPPPLCIACSGDVAELDDLLSQAGLTPEPALAAGREVPGLRRVLGPVGSVEGIPGAAEGRWWVQDAAAAAVADLVGCRPGWRVLDACAAPGGKTFRLCSQGGQVLAVDRSAERLARLEQGRARLALNCGVREHDWSLGAMPGESVFDAVLVDAPCSGLGTLRRHPEIRWNRHPDDPARNAERQLAILRATAAHVKPGGVLVYAVCSAEPEEGEQVVERFLAQRGDFHPRETFCSAPPSQDEDAFWAIRLVQG